MAPSRAALQAAAKGGEVTLATRPAQQAPEGDQAEADAVEAHYPPAEPVRHGELHHGHRRHQEHRRAHRGEHRAAEGERVARGVAGEECDTGVEGQEGERGTPERDEHDPPEPRAALQRGDGQGAGHRADPGGGEHEPETGFVHAEQLGERGHQLDVRDAEEGGGVGEQHEGQEEPLGDDVPHAVQEFPAGGGSGRPAPEGRRWARSSPLPRTW